MAKLIRVELILFVHARSAILHSSNCCRGGRSRYCLPRFVC